MTCDKMTKALGRTTVLEINFWEPLHQFEKAGVTPVYYIIEMYERGIHPHEPVLPFIRTTIGLNVILISALSSICGKVSPLCSPEK